MDSRTSSVDGDKGEKRHLFDDPGNVKRLIKGYFAVCALIVALELFVHRHPTFEGGMLQAETWFGFHAAYGFVAYVLLVLIAGQLRKLLMRPEDYYDR